MRKTHGDLSTRSLGGRGAANGCAWKEPRGSILRLTAANWPRAHKEAPRGFGRHYLPGSYPPSTFPDLGSLDRAQRLRSLAVASIYTWSIRKPPGKCQARFINRELRGHHHMYLKFSFIVSQFALLLHITAEVFEKWTTSRISMFPATDSENKVDKGIRIAWLDWSRPNWRRAHWHYIGNWEQISWESRGGNLSYIHSKKRGM